MSVNATATPIGATRNRALGIPTDDTDLTPERPAAERANPEALRDGFEPHRDAPVELGDPAARAAPASNVQPAADRPTTYPGGIDRRRFLDELSRRPDLVRKAAWMVRGEVGAGASQQAKIQMLETAFNRAQVRGHSLEQALLSVGESRRGYYARQTYRGSPPNAAELADFKRNVLAPVLSGSDLTSLGGRGPMTGNASAGVAQRQLARGTPGFPIRIAGGQTEHLFNEERKNLRDERYLPRLNAQTAEEAANGAQRIAPGGVLPPTTPGGDARSVSPPSVPAGADDEAPAARSARRASRSRPHSESSPSPRRARRSEATDFQRPMSMPAPASSPTANSPQALEQRLAQFFAWLNGRAPTSELAQQFVQEQAARSRGVQVADASGMTGISAEAGAQPAAAEQSAQRVQAEQPAQAARAVTGPDEAAPVTAAQPGAASDTQRRLAQAGVRTAMNMGGYRSQALCARGVKRAIQSVTGARLTGNANDLAAQMPRAGFRQVNMSLADALKTPGLVLTWQTTPTRMGRRYGHTAITTGDGRSSASDFVERNTLASSAGRTGLRVWAPIN